MEPYRYQVGEQVKITAENLKTMHNSNRSCVTPNYPDDRFLKQCKLISEAPFVEGKVTHTFPPGYEVTARFKGFTRLGVKFNLSLHMKDNWITPRFKVNHGS